ncbi:aspartate aminotransferase family protein [Desulfobacula sp.]|uniref:aspartate aminotransferase family protein n=1 Tax=Desulfobacula sp. TaxID=2593537 RepID=UPI00261219D5|nr:aspartate aminotransferase family protein [Desulfobacula sp.]
MIKESDLEKLSFPDAPNIITDSVPGPKSLKQLQEAPEFESMARGAGRFPFVFDDGFGSTVKDPDGNLYIDITAGVAVNSVGRRHPRVVEAINKQSNKLMHASDCSSSLRLELAKKVSGIMPKGLKDNCITYFTQSGSSALESAIKFVRKITGRSQIIAFHGAYHGVHCGCGSLTTGDQYRKDFGPFIPGVIHAPYPYSYRCCFGTKSQKACEEMCANYVEYLLNTPYTAADDVGAVIIEAQQGEGGYLAPNPEFFQRLKASCERHGALFIADEVQSGAGRSGKMWAIEHSDVEPDMLTFGKGMGGDVPMAGLSIRKDLAKKIVDGSQPNTFAANGVSAAVCMTNIDIITENDCELVNRVAKLGEQTKKRLLKGAKEIDCIGDVRGRGYMIGIELVKDKKTKEPFDADLMGQVIMGMMGKGIILVPCGRYGNVLRFMPPLTIPKKYLDRASDALLEVLGDIHY